VVLVVELETTSSGAGLGNTPDIYLKSRIMVEASSGMPLAVVVEQGLPD
jgi:hypothetical protein